MRFGVGLSWVLSAFLAVAVQAVQVGDRLQDATTLRRYRVIEVLGAGEFGTVVRVEAAEGSGVSPPAYKIFHVAPGKTEEGAAAQARFEKIRQKKSPYLMRYGPAVTFTIEGRGSFQVRDALPVAVMAGGTLDKVIEAFQTPASAETPEVFLRRMKRVQRLANHLEQGLKHLGELGLAHSDLKPANIFLSHTWEEIEKGTGHFLLGDYDTLGEIGESNENRVVTPEYVAPEILRTGKTTRESDFFSTGCLLYELLLGKAPYLAYFERQGIAGNFAPAFRKLLESPAEWKAFETFVRDSLREFSDAHAQDEGAAKIARDLSARIQASVHLDPTARSQALIQAFPEGALSSHFRIAPPTPVSAAPGFCGKAFAGVREVFYSWFKKTP